MKKILFMERYPVYEMTIEKSNSRYANVDAILAYLKEEIDNDTVAAYIAMFDQYAHTSKLNGEINPDIKEAKEIIFCFGQKLPNATIMSIRPRAIGVADVGESFVVSFMEAPNEPSTNKMIEWVKKLKKA